jgi:hypothetical protein
MLLLDHPTSGLIKTADHLINRVHTSFRRAVSVPGKRYVNDCLQQLRLNRYHLLVQQDTKQMPALRKVCLNLGCKRQQHCVTWIIVVAGAVLVLSFASAWAQTQLTAQSLNGLWLTDGYGDLIEFQGDDLRIYEITSLSASDRRISSVCSAVPMPSPRAFSAT